MVEAREASGSPAPGEIDDVVREAKELAADGRIIIDERVSRLGKFINLGTATVGGAVATAGIIASSHAAVSVLEATALGASVMAKLGALAVFIYGYSGLGRTLELWSGPTVDLLLLEASTLAHGTRRSRRLNRLGAAVEHNHKVARRLAETTWLGLVLLAVGLAGFLVGLAFIVGSAISG